jgi:hypothetical protein
LTAIDHPNDPGTAIDLSWSLSPDDAPAAGENQVLKYEILRAERVDGDFVSIGEATAGSNKFTDPNAERGKPYYYQVVAVSADESRSRPTATDAPAIAVMQVFDWGRAWFGGVLITICGAVLLFIQLARTGIPLRIRKIAGLAAVEEAVGRATEMGRPLIFINGIQDLDNLQTVAGLTVLSRVAKIAAEHDAAIEVPTSRSLVMTAARETVQASFLSAGRPDAYNQDKIYYVTDEQFGFVAAVAGLIVREKPAAIFYMGAFFAESLFLAETGNSVGAIQLAGTAEPAQLPFFVAACDYTLIGEEFFAASAYLSGEPLQLGSLKGQDVGKIMVGMLILVGCLMATMQAISHSGAIGRALNYLMNTVLQAG